LSKWLEHAARKTGKPNLVLAMISMLLAATPGHSQTQFRLPSRAPACHFVKELARFWKGLSIPETLLG
jgi:hypothetical protein